MKEMICIICPKGCRLKVDENPEIQVVGNACPRGIQYAKEEITDPRRVVTSTVRIRGGMYPRCPVKSNGSIPKDKVRDAVRALCGIELSSPVKTGQTVAENILDTGISFVTTREM